MPARGKELVRRTGDCPICCETKSGDDDAGGGAGGGGGWLYGLACGHLACLACWGRHIDENILGRAICRLRCPGRGWSWRVPHHQLAVLNASPGP